jgi:alkaline phosphatase
MGSIIVSSVARAEPARNVIICFGDGMGYGQMEAGRAYLGRTLSFENMPYTGSVATACADSAITDSAAAGTAIFTGHKVNSYVVGQANPPDPGFTNGQEYVDVAESMKARGKSVGSLTTCFINDATPAAFAAHELHRENRQQILDDIFIRARPNLVWGGSAADYYMTPAYAIDKGYSVVTNRSDLLALPTTNADVRSCALFGNSSMGFEYDGGLGITIPHLSEMTLKALQILQNNTNGFILLVESGEIDLACHSSDINKLTGEMVEFDRTVSVVTNWAAGRSDTLVLVCADHETQGLTNVVSNGAGNYPDGQFTASYHTAWNVPCFAAGPGGAGVTTANHTTNLFGVIMGAPNSAPGDLTTWTAYNDMSWTTGQPSLHLNLCNSGRLTTLLDYASGSNTPAQVVFTGTPMLSTLNPAPPPAGSDADVLFSGKASGNGYQYWTADTVNIDFSGLNPATRYTFALYGCRGSADTKYVERTNVVRIVGAQAFINRSSDAAARWTSEMTDDTTAISAANPGGWLTRYDAIQPSTHGTLTLAVTATGGASTTAYINVFMLATESVAPVDVNTNGLPDAWEVQYFGSINATNGGPLDDFDDDGFNNWCEWRAGTEPNVFRSRLEFAAGGLPTDGTQIVLQWAGVSGKAYSLLSATNVATPWNVVISNLPGQTINIRTVNVVNPARFWRIRVE